MNIVLPYVRTRRASAVAFFATAAVLLASGVATAAYSGKTSSGEILTCFKPSTGAVRIVDHLPCKKGEQALRWNSRGPVGPAGQNGSDGTDGADGGVGPAGPAGRDGKDITGAQGDRGEKGDAGAGTKGDRGDAGDVGAQGAPGDPGARGEKGDAGGVGPKGDKGDVGPVGPAGSASSAMQFGQATNNTDPDCAMVAPAGRTTAAACSFGSIQNIGEYLPSNAVIGGFRVLLDRTVNAQVDIIARTLDPSSSAPVDAFVLCSVPAGSNTCAQGAERTLTGPNLFALQLSGDRSWAKARFGYSLVQR